MKTTELQKPATSPASDGSAVQSGLIRRLRNHIAMMAPHQKERQTGKLLIEATECLEMCERVIEKQLFANPPNDPDQRPAK
jgi:predicted metal-binding protein